VLFKITPNVFLEKIRAFDYVGPKRHNCIEKKSRPQKSIFFHYETGQEIPESIKT